MQLTPLYLSLVVLGAAFGQKAEVTVQQMPKCRQDQLYRWLEDVKTWECVDDPNGKPGHLSVDMRLRIRAAQRLFENARYEASAAFMRLQQTTPGVDWLNKEKELRDKAQYLSELERGAREQCEKTKGFVYVTESAQCEIPKMPMPEGVK